MLRLSVATLYRAVYWNKSTPQFQKGQSPDKVCLIPPPGEQTGLGIHQQYRSQPLGGSSFTFVLAVRAVVQTGEGHLHVQIRSRQTRSGIFSPTVLPVFGAHLASGLTGEQTRRSIWENQRGKRFSSPRAARRGVLTVTEKKKNPPRW